MASGKISFLTPGAWHIRHAWHRRGSQMEVVCTPNTQNGSIGPYFIPQRNNLKAGNMCCMSYPWFTRITWFAWRFDAHLVIAMDIPIRHGYFVFCVVLRPRIMQSARDNAPLAQSIVSIVARKVSWKEPYHYYGFRVPGAISVITRRNPTGQLPLCQTIFTAGSITYPTHTGHILCLVYSPQIPPQLKDARNEP